MLLPVTEPTATEGSAYESDPVWVDALLNGHRAHRLFRAFYRHVPRGPRCKVCSAPYHGIGGKVFGMAGFKPSRKNPNVCGACVESLPPGGAEIDIGILFADVRGSTELGERLGPAAFAGRMNAFYSATTNVLLEHDGLIDKLIGDEVMALFFQGLAGADYRRQACEAGTALQHVLVSEGGPGLPVGIAVHAGKAFVGNVGKEVIDFTALGDTVNTAARLQSLAEPGELVISDEAYAAAPPSLSAERRTVSLRGRSEPITVHVVRP